MVTVGSTRDCGHAGIEFIHVKYSVFYRWSTATSRHHLLSNLDNEVLLVKTVHRWLLLHRPALSNTYTIGWLAWVAAYRGITKTFTISEDK